MTFTLFCIIWYMIGVLGCVLGTMVDLEKGIDFTRRDAVGCSLISLFGVITFVIGLTGYLSLTEKSKVIMKGKRK